MEPLKTSVSRGNFKIRCPKFNRYSNLKPAVIPEISERTILKITVNDFIEKNISILLIKVKAVCKVFYIRSGLYTSKKSIFFEEKNRRIICNKRSLNL